MLTARKRCMISHELGGFVVTKKKLNSCFHNHFAWDSMSADGKRSNSRKVGRKDVRPPNPPWSVLKPGDGSKAALCFYYSDPRSEIPVREVSHKNDPKGDPNLETSTFGLFSTCCKRMRPTIVKEGVKLLFFCTNRSRGRVLTGYYDIGWYYKVPNTEKDFMLAAQKRKFVSPGFPLHELTPYLRGVRLDRRFRTFRYIDGRTAKLLLLLLKDTPDATDQYLREIHRLEKVSLKEDGYLYQRKYPEGFSWDFARRPMQLES
jgi:hypothetical protein